MLDANNDLGEAAAARGGRVDDISTLTAGTFHASSDGIPITLLRMPNCLSHHLPSPPSDDEVMERARARLGPRVRAS